MSLNKKTKVEASRRKDTKKMQGERQEPLLGISFPNALDEE